MAQIPDNSTTCVTYREFQLLRRYLYPSLDEPRRGTDDVEVMFLMKRLYDDFNRSPVLVPFSGDLGGAAGSSASAPPIKSDEPPSIWGEALDHHIRQIIHDELA